MSNNASITNFEELKRPKNRTFQEWAFCGREGHFKRIIENQESFLSEFFCFYCKNKLHEL